MIYSDICTKMRVTRTKWWGDFFYSYLYFFYMFVLDPLLFFK